MKDQHTVVIVGGGPRATYALERLAAQILAHPPRARLKIAVFERGGEFGAGEAHAATQPRTSYLNRVAGQIGLCADESNVGCTALLPAEARRTFSEWCRDEAASSGDPRYAVSAQDVPARYLHGLALRDAFARYASLLRGVPGVTVELHVAEVVDVSEQPRGQAPFLVHAAGGLEVWADSVLFVTGHGSNHPAPGSWAAKLSEHARGGAHYVPYAYPLHQRVSTTNAAPGSEVAVLGLGLTAIDVFLHLTEGRGGRFEPCGAELRYIPSGREPRRIWAVSPSGALYTCRPHNAKQEKPAELEHKPVFFSLPALATLRRNLGHSCRNQYGERLLQLDFEAHVLPLIVLEMAWVYYRTLLGDAFAGELSAAVDPRYHRFLERGHVSPDAGIAYLLEPIQACFERAAASTPSLRAHAFDWRSILEPLSSVGVASGAEWRERTLDFLRRDLADAEQNNLRNPRKAACDGVWRDLRAVLGSAVDRGGLLPDSERRFQTKYLRLYSRLSNGAGIEPMRKVLALLEHGVLDVSLGPSPRIELEPDAGVTLRGPRTGVVARVSSVIEGRLHPFDPRNDTCPLYRNLLERGLVRFFWNPGPDVPGAFAPGGLDLCAAYHPRRSDGSSERRLSFLGAALERTEYFQMAAARPRSNSALFNQADRWAREVVSSLGSEPVSSKTPLITEFRAKVRAVLQRERASAAPRHVVALGIDGVCFRLAQAHWPHARLEKMQSVFPTTSSAGWLSSLSGLPVDAHGVPGVVFKLPGSVRDLINVFQSSEPLLEPDAGNVFSDSRALGYEPICLLGDLEAYDCAWRDLLLRHARRVAGHKLYTARPAEQPESPRALVQQLGGALRELLRNSHRPCFVWCFVETDRYVHVRGYDDHVRSFLSEVDQLACQLASEGVVTVAHSDHGLVRTAHDSQLEDLLARLARRHAFQLGGAGRTRFVYAPQGRAGEVHSALERSLPADIRLLKSSEVFEPGSLASARAGDLLLVATGERFLAPAGYHFDHGSCTPDELDVPYSEWLPAC